MSKVRINGKEYAWGDVEVVMWGRPIVGLTAIDYKLAKSKEALYAAGRTPKGIQHGQRSASGSITVTQSELEAMNRAARQKGYKDILDVDFNLIVSYLPEDSLALTVDEIVCASISEIPKGMKQGDMKSEHALPFVAMDIEYDVANPVV